MNEILTGVVVKDSSNMKKAILVSCFGWYDNRLKYIRKYLEELGYNVEVVLSDFDHITKKRVEWDNSIITVHVPKYMRNISLSRIISHVEFSCKTRKFIMSEEPQLIWCMIPPNTLAYCISRLKKKVDYYLIYDIVDLWPESLPLKDNNIVSRHWKHIRSKYINRAEKIVLECDHYKDIISDEVSSDKLTTIRLVKEKNDTEAEMLPIEEGVYLAYLGSINSLVDVEKCKHVIRTLKAEYPVYVRVIGDGNRRKAFIGELTEAGATVEYYGKIYDENEKRRILGPCHFAINLYKDGLRIGLTLKSLDYMQMGLPLINSIQGDTRELVENGVGINYEDFNLERINEFISNIDKKKAIIKEVFNAEFSVEAFIRKLSFLKDIG